jgi:UDP-GlcNAc:undecaprenyl-phosphate GlcNAc-1-phosphate transferase
MIADRNIMSVFILSFAITFILVYRMRYYISFYGFVSRQDYRRRWYKEPTPLLGGLSILASLIFTELIFTNQINSLFIMIFPLILVGVIEDQREVTYKLKILFQIISISLWLYLTPVETIFLSQLGFSVMTTYFLAGVWVFIIINSINLIDGMDGLACGFGIIISIFMLNLDGNILNPQLLFSLIGSLCGFIYWNLKPAQIYLGRAGSHLIGFILSTQILTWHPINAHLINILVPFFLMTFPLMNILMAVWRKYRDFRTLSFGEGYHIYHLIIRSGFSVIKTWIFIMTAVAILAYYALLIALQSNTVLLGLFSVSIVILFSYMVFLVFQMEKTRSDYFDQLVQNLFKEHLKPIDLVEVTSEDCLIVYSFSDFKSELLRLPNGQLERWLVDAVQFIKTHHSEHAKIFMSLDGDLLILDPKINVALRFHNFHQKFHDYIFASANHNEYWPLLLLKYMPVIEVGRLPGNIEIEISEESPGRFATKPI